MRNNALMPSMRGETQYGMDTTPSDDTQPQSSTSVGATLTSYNITEVSFDRLSVGEIDATGTISAGGFVTGASPDPRIEITSTLIAGYSDATTKQFYLSATDGKAYAAAGGVMLDTAGVTLTHASAGASRYVTFRVGAVTVSTMGANDGAGAGPYQTNIVSNANDSIDRGVTLVAQNYTGTVGGIIGCSTIDTLVNAKSYVVVNNASQTATGLYISTSGASAYADWWNGLTTRFYSDGGGALTGSINASTGAVVFNEDGNSAGDFRVESDTEANMLFLDANGSTDGLLYLGGTTNGLTVSKGGEFTMLGTATVWDDLRVDVLSTKLGGADPGFAVFKDNGAGSKGVFIYWFDKASIEEVFFAVQLPHSWASTAVYPHVHWVPKTADATGLLTVEWGLEYTWVNLGGAFGNTGIVYAKSAAGLTTASKHILTSFAAITPGAGTQDGISSMILCRLFRNATDAVDDTYDDDAGLLEFDVHYEMNTIGSKTESAK